MSLLYNIHKYHRQWTPDNNNVKKHNEFKKVNFNSGKWNKHCGERRHGKCSYATDRCDFESFYQKQSGVFGSVSNDSILTFSSNGNLLTDKKEITKRWAENLLLKYLEGLNEFECWRESYRKLTTEFYSSISYLIYCWDEKKSHTILTNWKSSGNDGIEIHKCGKDK